MEFQNSTQLGEFEGAAAATNKWQQFSRGSELVSCLQAPPQRGNSETMRQTGALCSAIGAKSLWNKLRERSEVTYG